MNSCTDDAIVVLADDGLLFFDDTSAAMGYLEVIDIESGVYGPAFTRGGVEVVLGTRQTTGGWPLRRTVTEAHIKLYGRTAQAAAQPPPGGTRARHGEPGHRRTVGASYEPVRRIRPAAGGEQRCDLNPTQQSS